MPPEPIEPPEVVLARIKRALTEEPILYAYTLIPDPEHPGYYYDVMLKGVYQEDIIFLERSGRSSKPMFGLQRIEAEMLKRHRRKEWNR